MNITERIVALDDARRKGLLQTYRELLHTLLDDGDNEDVIKSINDTRLALAFGQKQVEKDVATLRRVLELTKIAALVDERHKASEAVRVAMNKAKEHLTAKEQEALNEFNQWNNNRLATYANGEVVAPARGIGQRMIGERTRDAREELHRLTMNYGEAATLHDESRKAVEEIDDLRRAVPHLGL